MAIYSLNLKSIGRTTHAAGTAGAHLLYIARPDARPELMAEYMPTDPNEARAWMNRAELADRKNARVVDKVRIALPRELTPDQRRQLIQDFARELTGNRVAWFAAIHAEGKDALNPHCHLVIRDRDLDTGKRVLCLSDSPRDRTKAGLEPKAVEWVRTLWEHRANQALESAGHDVRIDRRSLEAQGVDREPTIHIGPQAVHVEDFVQRPVSKIVETGNGRSIDYPQIDAGRTRKDRHAEIVDINLEKATRSKDFRTRELAKVQKRQADLDRALENRLVREARARTQEHRKMRAAYRAKLNDVHQAHRDDLSAMKAMFRQEWRDKRSALTGRHKAAREAMKREHGRFSSRLLRIVDVTGRTRRSQDAERKVMQDRQKDDRQALVTEHRARKTEHRDSLAQGYRLMRRELRAVYAPGFEQMKDSHQEAEREADRERQMRAVEREMAEQKTEQAISKAERVYRSMQRPRSRERGFDIGR